MLKLIRKVFKIIFLRFPTDWIPDKPYLQIMYRLMTGKKLHLDNPQLFNEKLQWLKLYDRKNIYTQMADKYEVKGIVSELIGKEHVIPVLGIWYSPEDIKFEELPAQFVLKTTHDSGGVVVCRDKSSFDMAAAVDYLKSRYKNNYFYMWREWPYKDIKPRVLAEKYMQDGDTTFLPVYKFFCFNGKPEIIQSIQNDKQKDETIDYFDTEWNVLDLRQNFPNSSVLPPKPEKLDEMLKIAEKAANGKNFIRVDLFLINGEIYFSEYTFFTDAGFEEFHPKEWDKVLGEKLAIFSLN